MREQLRKIKVELNRSQVKWTEMAERELEAEKLEETEARVGLKLAQPSIHASMHPCILLWCAVRCSRCGPCGMG